MIIRTICFFFLAVLFLIVLVLLSVVLTAGVLLCIRPIKKLYAQRSSEKDFCPLSEIPDTFIRLILMAEDSFFYEHKGFRIKAIKGAAKINWRSGKIVTGGSSITQQLVKNLYFHFRRSYFRKAVELVLAVHAEHVLSKEQILDLYMNVIYFGNGVYGISDAARFYFDRDVRELTANQMFILSCIPSAPTKGNPIQYPEIFVRIRDRILDRLIDEKNNKTLIFTMEEIEEIRSHGATCLDAELRENDSYTQSYPQDIVLVNERFGPFRPSKHLEPYHEEVQS